MKKKMISLFTGAGGLDWGFHNSNNYELVIANEILKPHLKTYADNHKIKLIDIKEYNNDDDVAVCGDIHELSVPLKTDIIMGGPPCQDFSVLRGSDNRAGFTVRRGKLYEQYLRIIESTNPDVFVFENVVGMVSANKGAAYEAIQDDFKDAGYDLVFNDILNMSNIGVPQARKRLIIIGINKKLKIDENKAKDIINKYLCNPILEKYPLVPLEVFEGKILTDLQDSYVSIMKKYSDCMNGIDNEYSEKWKSEYESLTFDIKEDYLTNNNVQDYDDAEFDHAMKEHENILKILGYYGRKVDEQTFIDDTNNRGRKNRKVTERMHHIPPYYNFKAVDNTEWKVKGLMSNIYKRIHPLKPSPTVIAYGGGGTGGYHYEYDRQGLTNRERARLQTFPDNYIFNGKTTEIRAQIGEAVPPLASYWIEKVVHDILNL
ncbi:DNA cytosine methyltransferase [uncultured Methanobrevibacter sp.]|uniref:DNA cytosine methyltransferase n=1 Tax=uncultured Methanobrevibacter sp. TaxID=253161 RepID=UPI0025CE1117|nr:DNA cytosine methyltransferase [uncultured Methanobrevibacter sp.]